MYVIRSDGSNFKRISKGKNMYEYDFFPDISPDGSRIVYMTSRHLPMTTRHDSRTGDTYERKVRTFEIETSNLDGSDRQRITNHGNVDSQPAWSPNGDRIAFARLSVWVWSDDPTAIFTIALTAPTCVRLSVTTV